MLLAVHRLEIVFLNHSLLLPKNKRIFIFQLSVYFLVFIVLNSCCNLKQLMKTQDISVTSKVPIEKFRGRSLDITP